MIHTLFALAVAALPMQRYDTDTTVSVPRGSRLRINNFGGDVTIKGWSRGEMRVQADHSSRDGIEVDVRGQVVEIRSRGRLGMPSMADLEVTVPVWMGLEISGISIDIAIDGVEGPVKAQTIEGDITLRGGAESVSLSAVSGSIDVRGARGRVSLNSASDDIRAADITGELTIEAISGDVTLRNIDATRVEVQSISGDIEFDGGFAPRGSYIFSSHSGSVTLAIPDRADAALSVVSATGGVRSSFRVEPERESRRRANYRFGNGSATIEVETFSGGLRLIRPSELRPERPRPERERRKNNRDDRDDRRGGNQEHSDHERGVAP